MTTRNTRQRPTSGARRTPTSDPRHADKRGPADADKRPEIAIVRYRECQLAAVYGLTDVFRVANEQLARSAETRLCA
ncbi:hypothetical protein IOD13_01360 [Brevibacterium casei]|nr:hypothetical protein [Brevibacterium casei]